ncbi:MAG TPA: PHP domain-containing protein [Cycloclasticus sp.]|jgi:predicted metal-dependent phosphoesterase TrpH|nr:PHP domain-containing protein [Cycloclasticus sp.]
MTKIDLHSHTLVSDGSLSPVELVERAKANGVTVLSITDHDSIGAYSDVVDMAGDGLTIIPGIEFSTQWRGIGIHIVGLNLQLDSPSILEGVAQQEKAREERAELICKRLKKAGVAVDFERVKELAQQVNVGRPHFAQHLVEIGAVKNMSAAFKKYLGDGKMGDVKQCWAELPTIVQWITEAGGIAVLAHPLKYKMTRTKLRLFLDDFIEAGGRGMEVVSGQQSNNDTGQLAQLCREKGLLGSCGSDFHQVSQWSDVGSMATFPKNCDPVWQAWT